MYDEFEPALSLQFLSAYMHADPSRACMCYMVLCKGFRLAPSAGWYNAAIGSQPVWYVLHTALQSFIALVS